MLYEGVNVDLSHHQGRVQRKGAEQMASKPDIYNERKKEPSMGTRLPVALLTYHVIITPDSQRF